MLDELETVSEDELVFLVFLATFSLLLEDDFVSFLLLEEVFVLFFLDEEVAEVFFLLCFVEFFSSFLLVELVLEVCSVLGVSADESESSVGEIITPVKNIIIERSTPISDFLRSPLFFLIKDHSKAPTATMKPKKPTKNSNTHIFFFLLSAFNVVQFCT